MTKPAPQTASTTTTMMSHNSHPKSGTVLASAGTAVGVELGAPVGGALGVGVTVGVGVGVGVGVAVITEGWPWCEFFPGGVPPPVEPELGAGSAEHVPGACSVSS